MEIDMPALWAAVVMICVSSGASAVTTYIPFYDLMACESARRDLKLRMPSIESNCVPTITGNASRHNVQ